MDLTRQTRGLTNLVVHLITSAIVSKVLANKLLGQPRTISESEFALNVAQPTVRPCCWYRDQ